MQVLDKSGVYVRNVVSFGFQNPETKQYIGADGDYYKVTPSPWLKMQMDHGLFVIVDEDGVPLEGDDLKAELDKRFPAPAAAAAPAAAEAKAAEAPAPAAKK